MKYLFILVFLVAHAQAKNIILSYDFNDGLQNWQAKFADYPFGEEEFFELNSGIRPLPPEISTNRQGLFISGNNHSDDLFMYMTKAIGKDEGIRARATYDVKFRVTFDSNAPTGCLGTGGAPGEGVILQGNVINQMPETFIDDLNHVRTRFSHGNLISNIANGIECENSQGEYVSLVRTQPGTKRIRAGKDGKLWLIVGTDSGFESTTSLFYEKIEVFLEKVNNSPQ